MNIEIPDALAYELIGKHISDEIVSRLACNEIPEDIGEWLRREYSHSFYMTNMLGYGPNSVVMRSEIRPDGSIFLQLTDTNSCPFWQTVLRPVTG